MLILASAAPSTLFAIDRYSFEIGVYYGPKDPSDNFNWDWALMDMARNGCTEMVVSSPMSWNSLFWYAAKNWGIKAIAGYNILNDGAPDYIINESQMTASILANKQYWDSMSPTADNMIGFMLCDEPEGGGGLSTAKQDYVRKYCDLYKINDPTRQSYINHAGLPWYDLHEAQSSSSAPRIFINHQYLYDTKAEAQRLGKDGFTCVPQINRISDGIDGHSDRIYGLNMGFGTQEAIDFIASRTAYQDVYEEMMTSYICGTKGCVGYTYAPEMSTTVYSLVDQNGLDNDYRRKGFGDAASDIRASQGWPSVTLKRKVTMTKKIPLYDRRNYPAGSITLNAATTTASGSTLSKVIFGMSTDGGASFSTAEDTTYPFENTYTLVAGTTVILRAQAVDSLNRKSIWAANMIYVVASTAIACGDYESALLPADINKDCRVNLGDVDALAQQWVWCDDPSNPQCGTVDLDHQFYCGQYGSGFPGLDADLNSDCKIDFNDFAILANSWMDCDNPSSAGGCP